jgi:hypothetical protein
MTHLVPGILVESHLDPRWQELSWRKYVPGCFLDMDPAGSHHVKQSLPKLNLEKKSVTKRIKILCKLSCANCALC